MIHEFTILLEYAHLVHNNFKMDEYLYRLSLEWQSFKSDASQPEKRFIMVGSSIL